MLLYAGVLEVRDITERFQQSSSWSIPDTLSVYDTLNMTRALYAYINIVVQDDLQKYATAFVLCHNISSYRGKVSKALMVTYHHFCYTLMDIIELCLLSGCIARTQSLNPTTAQGDFAK